MLIFPRFHQGSFRQNEYVFPRPAIKCSSIDCCDYRSDCPAHLYSGNCVKDKQFAWDFCPLSCGMCPIAEACDKAARLRGGVTGCPRLQRSSGSWEIDAQTLLRHAQEYVGTN